MFFQKAPYHWEVGHGADGSLQLKGMGQTSLHIQVCQGSTYRREDMLKALKSQQKCLDVWERKADQATKSWARLLPLQVLFFMIDLSTFCFRYKNDSVAIVEKYGFYHCDSSNPIAYFDDGDTVVPEPQLYMNSPAGLDIVSRKYLTGIELVTSNIIPISIATYEIHCARLVKTNHGFRYKNDSVAIVEKYGFYHCDSSNPIAFFDDGDTVRQNRPYFETLPPPHPAPIQIQTLTLQRKAAKMGN
nr:early nodulin-like protein 1 [Tanacetum cinerariifolium]